MTRPLSAAAAAAHKGMQLWQVTRAPPAFARPPPHRQPARLQGRRPRCTACARPPLADFDSTPRAVRGLVSALTAVINTLNPPPPLEQSTEARPAVSREQLLAGLREEFEERLYLWTGDISPQLYELDCRFTDPTLSFIGLATFQRNLASLQPVLRALLNSREVDLLSLELVDSSDSAEAGYVEAAWRMGANIAAPWQPRLELTGRTRFTFSVASQGRIARYDERWDIPASEALLQLVRPFRWKRPGRQIDKAL
jgi:hypothetical protein